MNHHIKDIKEGDVVYIFAAESQGGEGGIIADGIVTAPPDKGRKPFPWEKEYDIKSGKDKYKARLELTYVRVFGVYRLTPGTLPPDIPDDIRRLKDDGCPGVYLVTEPQAEAIDTLINRTKIDWLNRPTAC